MVRIHIKDGKTYYSCSICGLVYQSIKYAKLCEDYCSKHPGSCSIEISKYAVGYLIRHSNGTEKMKFYRGISTFST